MLLPSSILVLANLSPRHLWSLPTVVLCVSLRPVFPQTPFLVIHSAQKSTIVSCGPSHQLEPQCQAFENQGFFKLGLILWGWPIAFIPHQSASQKKNVYIFIFFSHVPSFSWLEILKGFILHTLGAKQYRHIPTEQNNFHLHMGGFIESLILCCLLLLLLPSIFLSIKAFSNQSALRIRWQTTGVSASASVSVRGCHG